MTDNTDRFDTIDLDRRETKVVIRGTRVEIQPLDLVDGEDSSVFDSVDSGTVAELRRRNERAERQAAKGRRPGDSSKATVADLEADDWKPVQAAPPLQLNDDSNADEVRNTGLGDDVGVTIRTRSIRPLGNDDPAIDADYEIVKQIGEGGIGVVYEDRQTSIDRRCAVKMLRTNGGELTEAELTGIRSRRRFFAEAVVTGDLDHPNIVPIYDLGTDENGNAFYSMKCVSGTPWHQVIAQKSQAENIDILMSVCDAIAFAHSRGVIHRDLKPENVMLGEYGEVLVMDWGLAMTTETFTKAGGTTKRGEFGGTPSYMAPEMTCGDVTKIGTHSDVYLLGAILYEIVTGHPPHAGADVKDCLRAASRNEIHPTEKQGELVDIALKAMSTHAWNRHAGVAELQREIRATEPHSQSVEITRRAAADLAKARKSHDHQDFLKAIYGFEEAFELWSGNEEAERGISEARLAYARSAKEKGDLDLAACMLLADDASHDDTRKAVRLAQHERRGGRRGAIRRWTGSALALLLVAAVAYGAWITLEHRELRAERDEARFGGAATADVEQLQRDRDLALERVAALNEDITVEKSRHTAVVAERDAAIEDRNEAKTAAEVALAAKAAAEQALAKLENAPPTDVENEVAKALAEAKKEADKMLESVTDVRKQLELAVTGKNLAEKAAEKAKEDERAALERAKQAADAEAVALDKAKLAAEAEQQAELAVAAERKAKEAEAAAKTEAIAARKLAETELAKSKTALATTERQLEDARLAARKAEEEAATATAGTDAQTQKSRDAALLVWIAEERARVAAEQVETQLDAARARAANERELARQRELDALFAGFATDLERDAAKRAVVVAQLERVAAEFAEQRLAEADRARQEALRRADLAERERDALAEEKRLLAEAKPNENPRQDDPPKVDPPKTVPPKTVPPNVDPPKVVPLATTPPTVDPPKGTDPPVVVPPKPNLTPDARDRYAFGPWIRDAAGKFHHMKLEYKAQRTDTTYAFHYCIAYDSRPGFVYFYDPVAKEFWGRYEIAAADNANFAPLAPADRADNIGRIPEAAFGTAGPLPKVPGAVDATANIIKLPAIPGR